jgi:hypothetical protein
MTLSKLWADYIPDAVPTETAAVGESENDGIVNRKIYFTSEKTGDGEVRVFCSLSFKRGCDMKTAVVYAGDLFRGSDKVMTRSLAERGNLVADIDFGFKDGEHRTSYPKSLSFGVPDEKSRAYAFAEPDAKHTSRYVWAKILRRAAYFVKTEYGSENIILIGEASACGAAFMGGIDPLFSGLATIFGSGYSAYGGIYKYGKKELVIDEERQCFIAGADAQTYAKFIDKPVLMLLSTNGSYGDFDRAADLFGIFPGEKKMIVGAQMQDCISVEAAENLFKWIENIPLKIPPKSTPAGEIVRSGGKYYFNVTTPDFDGIEPPVVYYSTTDTEPFFREWKSVKAEETANGEFIARLPVTPRAKIIFAFANISYADGDLISSREYALRLDARGLDEDGGFKNRVVYSGETGVNFFPKGRGLIVSGGAQTAAGAYGIKGIMASDGGILNYSIGGCDTDGNVAAIQADVYTTVDKDFYISLHTRGEDGEKKYTCPVNVQGGAEWRRISIEPRMFKDASLSPLESFAEAKILEIDDAEGVIFNNILFV